MIDYALENRAKSEAIMTTECSRESDDRYDMTQFGRLDSSVRIAYVGIKMRQKTAVSRNK
jgi:hypothetical protein